MCFIFFVRKFRYLNLNFWTTRLRDTSALSLEHTTFRYISFLFSCTSWFNDRVYIVQQCSRCSVAISQQVCTCIVMFVFGTTTTRHAENGWLTSSADDGWTVTRSKTPPTNRKRASARCKDGLESFLTYLVISCTHCRRQASAENSPTHLTRSWSEKRFFFFTSNTFHTRLISLVEDAIVSRRRPPHREGIRRARHSPFRLAVV